MEEVAHSSANMRRRTMSWSHSGWGTLSATRQKISVGCRLLVVGDSLNPIHSLVGKLGTVC